MNGVYIIEGTCTEYHDQMHISKYSSVLDKSNGLLM